jgi:hypothetical protein
MTSASTILYLCVEGNKEHGVWLNEYSRQWEGKQEYTKCEYRMQQKRLTVVPAHLPVLSQKHELFKREHVQ